MKAGLLLAMLLGSAVVVVSSSGGPQDADPALVAEIARIRAIDNHSHASPASAPGDEPQDPIGAAPFAYPLRLRLDNPEYRDAWAALWGTPPGPDQARAALRAKWRARREKAEAYPGWVLDQAGIESALISADRLGPGQGPPRFLWVPMADELLFPAGNRRPRFRQILSECGLDEPPATLGQYVSQVLTPTLGRWKQAGAVSVKLAVAYRRSLDFGAETQDDAERAYAKLAAGAAGAAAEHKALQDYLFRLLCAEAGRAGLAVHIHTGVGADPHFNIAGSRPSLLEPALNDPALRPTRFVLVHGGWPFDREAGVMLMKPNVYADFSAQTFLRSTRALAETLRAWLEWYPEKVMFGTDAYPEDLMGVAAPLAGWEEKTWLAARTSREALALALTAMIRDGQITPDRAVEVARMVLRGNAQRLYGWPSGGK
jgi:predicted TIM-barrel fold metal-dependent hydrolase